MIIVMKPHAEKSKIEAIRQNLINKGFQINEIQGTSYCILGVVGDTSTLDPKLISANSSVEKIMHVQEPFKQVNRLFHPENSIINIANTSVGDKKLAVMAGPCSVESEEQILSVANSIKAAGANFLRGGAYKPRTSPYAFQGMEEDGLKLLCLAKKETGLPIVTELMSVTKLDQFVNYNVDVIQVGARNMQNFDMLKELGKTNIPILLKRGLSATIEEWLMSAEYIMAGGNENVILCERGIRTFEKYTRNTLDVSAIPAVKKLSHLPVIVDPSHAAGMWWMVEPLAKAAIAVGADGLMIEVHNDPVNAKCDGGQSLKPHKFSALMGTLQKMAEVVDREI